MTTKLALVRRSQSHSRRNVALGFLFLLAILGFFFLPVVYVGSMDFVGVYGSATVSLSYQVFRCGEVHIAFSGTLGNYDTWEWVCGNGQNRLLPQPLIRSEP